MTQVIRRKPRKETSESSAAAFAKAAKSASIPLKPKESNHVLNSAS
jgi:hypothetical protein